MTEDIKAMSQTGDIEKRLREGRTDGTALRWRVTPIHLEAAAEISALRAKLAEVEKVESDTIEYLRKEVATLRAERDHWKVNHDTTVRRNRSLSADVADLEAARTAAEAEVARLREGLEPFAKEASTYDDVDHADNHTAEWSNFTIGDLRRAAALTKGRADD